MPSLYDDLNKPVNLDTQEPRVVSLVPSHTETLVDLGIKVVGRTKFCIHPKIQIADISIIGGTKNPGVERIRALKPDLIVANREENNAEDVEKLRKIYPVYTSDISTFEDSLLFIKKISQLCQVTAKGHELSSQIRNKLEGIKTQPRKLKTLYLIWREPWMTVGGDTYIHHMMRRMGYDNCTAQEMRYPSLSAEDIQALDPEVILLSSEPYPFSDKHIAEMCSILPQASIRLVDGETYSWYGTRILYKDI